MTTPCWNRVAILSLLLLAAPLFAAEEPAEYIKVKTEGEYKLAALPIKELEAGKTLEVMVRGVLTDGLVAIGGETTGTVIKVGKTTWELDLGTDPKFKAVAKELSGKAVIVVGKVQKKDGVEVKTRTIVKVAGLTPAGK